jgi:hypothetical protein
MVFCRSSGRHRRHPRSAGAGQASPAARPGGLRDLVDAHLHAHPGTDFTAGQIGRVLPRSAGALVIDGTDRLYRARCQAIPALPACLLTPEESQAITGPARPPAAPGRAATSRPAPAPGNSPAP